MKFAALQNFVNKIYRHPKGERARIKRFGGREAYNDMLLADKEMRLAALNLKPVISYTDGLPVIFLTGENYLYQTVFCIASLVAHSVERFNFIIIDDGTFNEDLTILLQRLLPGCTLITADYIERNLEAILPISKYPIIRQKRLVYPHLKKLTDIHTIPGVDWKLVLDSDMLFMKDPTEMITWLKSPNVNLFIQDCMQSYGYSSALMQQLCGAAIPDKLNVGVAGMCSSAIDWNKIEYWIKTLEETGGTTYYLEQALTAMLAAGNPLKILPADEYIVYPNPVQTQNMAGTLHHYVDLSKKEYFTYCWKPYA